MSLIMFMTCLITFYLMIYICDYSTNVQKLWDNEEPKKETLMRLTFNRGRDYLESQWASSQGSEELE